MICPGVAWSSQQSVGSGKQSSMKRENSQPNTPKSVFVGFRFIKKGGWLPLVIDALLKYRPDGGSRDVRHNQRLSVVHRMLQKGGLPQRSPSFAKRFISCLIPRRKKSRPSSLAAEKVKRLKQLGTVQNKASVNVDEVNELTELDECRWPREVLKSADPSRH